LSHGAILEIVLPTFEIQSDPTLSGRVLRGRKERVVKEKGKKHLPPFSPIHPTKLSLNSYLIFGFLLSAGNPYDPLVTFPFFVDVRRNTKVSVSHMLA
jgi:hypothetical protein